ncbi:hypothetical protein [Pseudotamlana carrageenivorans]|uniref:hypothetical protein n=1 Tax=Pseudotamlana carrageenivorans TaxID=2069432 RepID=UPI001A7E162E|nr:hypothetical protein [Tamlana carrageenivorans]
MEWVQDTPTPKTTRKSNNVSEKEWCKLMFEWTSWLRQTNISLRYYLKIDPYTLTEKEWAMRVVELQWIRLEENKQHQK